MSAAEQTGTTVTKVREYLTGLWKHTFSDGSSVIQVNINAAKAVEIQEMVANLSAGDSIKVYKNKSKSTDGQPDYNLLIEKAPLAELAQVQTGGEF